MITARRTASSAFAAAAFMVAVPLAFPGSAAAGTPAVIYVSPSGTGSECSTASPCALPSALGVAGNDETIVMAPGRYPTTGGYADELELKNGASLIGGGTGKPTVINFTATASAMFDDATSHISGVQIYAPDAFQALFVGDNATADHVIVSGANDSNEGACDVQGGVLLDSVCLSGGSAAVYGLPSSFTGVVRNVTAIASGANGIGLWSDENGSGHTSLAVSNSILLGTKYGVQTTAEGGPGSASATIDHSDFASHNQGAGGTLTLGAGTISAAPKFVNASKLDFSERKGSATVDAGTTTGVAATETDLDGLPRRLGHAPDMGADEFAPKPVVHHAKVIGRHAHKITVAAKVTTGRLATTVKLRAKNGHATQTAAVHISHGESEHVTFAVRHLDAHTRYSLRISAKSSAGASAKKKLHVTTT